MTARDLSRSVNLRRAESRSIGTNSLRVDRMEQVALSGYFSGGLCGNRQFSEAVKWQKKSLEMKIPEAAVEPAQQRLLLYEQNKPYPELK